MSEGGRYRTYYDFSCNNDKTNNIKCQAEGKWDKGLVVAMPSAGRTGAAGSWKKGLVVAMPSAVCRAVA